MELQIEDIKNYFKDIFRQTAPEIIFDNINLNLPLRDQVEIDSLDLYNIVVALQQKTGVYIPDSKLAELTTLSELINYILKQQTKAGVNNELKS